MALKVVMKISETQPWHIREHAHAVATFIAERGKARAYRFPQGEWAIPEFSVDVYRDPDGVIRTTERRIDTKKRNRDQ